MQKRWAARPAPMLDIVEAANPYNLPDSISLLLARRGFSEEKLDRFLNPDMKYLSSWKDTGGIRKAAKRIIAGIENSENILIHGDFDADGITATTVVYLALKSLGARVSYFIPDRFEDGYGLGKSSIEACSASGTGLLITVDCGITGSGYVETLRNLNIDTIITDHHLPGDVLPDAEAVVDPVLDNSHSVLAGAGVAWMVLRAVYDLMGLNDEYLLELLQLVAIGTVADVVELTGDNRILVSEGLKVLRTKPLPGISALAESASVNIRKIRSTDIAYCIAPRLNACGRVGRASDAVELLLAGNSEEAGKLLETVQEHNRIRKKLDREMERHVLRKVKDLDNPKCIVMADSGWHRGVIGIVASRLVSRFGVPSIMISIEDDEGYGSARSVPGIPIHSILTGIQAEYGLMDTLGGHPMAAGFSIPEVNIPVLRDELIRILSGDEWKNHLGSVMYVDGKLEEQDYRSETASALEKLEPFGEGNRKPIWLARGVYPVQWRAIGKNSKHLSCNFRIGSAVHRAIGFNMADSQSLFNGKVDIAFALELDSYRGDGSLQLVLKGIRRHRKAAD